MSAHTPHHGSGAASAISFAGRGAGCNDPCRGSDDARLHLRSPLVGHKQKLLNTLSCCRHPAYGSVIGILLIGLMLCVAGLLGKADVAAPDASNNREGSCSASCCVTTLGSSDPNLNNCGGTRPAGLQFAGRSPVMASNGMAASSQPLATQAAIDVLKAGGSAVDAAIAANAVNGVTEPMSNGLGGDLMAIVWEEKTKTLHGLNSAGRSSESTTYDDMKSLLNSLGVHYIPERGPLSVSVPGAAMGWCMLHEKFGRVSWAAVLEPAVRYAAEGFPVSPVIADAWGKDLMQNMTQLTSGGKFPQAALGFYSTFSVGGKPPRAGEVFNNPELANSLRKLQQGGCAEFYNGSIARAIAAFADNAGTRITEQDLAAHRAEWVTPVNITYRERYRIFELPPNPQGLAALQQLNILENFDLRRMGFNTADYLHVHVEAKKLAFADRAKYYADPDFVDVPVEWLISKEYARNRSRLIDMQRAAEKVDAGVPTGHWSDSGLPDHQDKPHRGDTIYLTTADADGNMVSLIQSNYEGFGSGLAVPGLGFVLQNRGSLFSMRKGDADIYAPGKRPFHTIIPGFAFKDESPWLSFGVMGGNMQPQGHAQVLSNIIDFGMGLQEAGDAARYQHTGSSQPTGQVMTDGGAVVLEAGVCQAARDELQRRGHQLLAGANGGGYQAIERRTAADGRYVYVGASEMRKDGQAAGY